MQRGQYDLNWNVGCINSKFNEENVFLSVVQNEKPGTFKLEKNDS